MRQIANVSDLERFTTFLRLCAGRSGQELNVNALGADAGVSQPTARAWLSVLETSFLCHRLPAWRRNVRKQTIKAPKLCFLDSGLMCFLLGIRARHGHSVAGGARRDVRVGRPVLPAAVTRARDAVIDAIPLQLKLAVGAGIGMFIAFIGLRNPGFVVGSETTLVALGDLTAPPTLLASFGLLVTILLLVRGLPGAVFHGIVATVAAGIGTGQLALPAGVVGAVPSLGPTFGEAFRHLGDLFTAQMAFVVLTMPCRRATCYLAPSRATSP